MSMMAGADEGRQDSQQQLARIRSAYFADPARQLQLARGATLLDQDEANHRLYLLLSGEIIGYRRHQQEGEEPSFVEVFRAHEGAFIGLQSFFSGSFTSSSRLIAAADCELAYIERGVAAVEPQRWGSLAEQFMPLLVQELARRSLQATERAIEKEAALRQLHRSEVMTTLGQLAAGLAHELNNAIGVISRKGEYIASFVDELLQRLLPAEGSFFRQGQQQGPLLSDEQLRRRVRDYERQFALSRQAARLLARLAPTVEDARSLGPQLLVQLEHHARYWELGSDLHDLQLAARHAAAIVKSVKLLGRGQGPREPVDLLQSVKEALALLHAELRAVRVELLLPAEPLPPLVGDLSELVQIWVNLIKNACDAMAGAAVAEPQLQIRLQSGRNLLAVTISDNGPGIAEELRERVFQPDFTTKKSGLSFGLGLGLAIVQRLVASYGGEIQLRSRPGKTSFKVKLPTGDDHGAA